MLVDSFKFCFFLWSLGPNLRVICSFLWRILVFKSRLKCTPIIFVSLNDSWKPAKPLPDKKHYMNTFYLSYQWIRATGPKKALQRWKTSCASFLFHHSPGFFPWSGQSKFFTNLFIAPKAVVKISVCRGERFLRFILRIEDDESKLEEMKNDHCVLRLVVHLKLCVVDITFGMQLQ